MESQPTRGLLESIPLGVGTWAWGDTLFWEYGKSHTEATVREAFTACLESGIRLFDTAETYGWGKSERLLGQFIRESGQQGVVATKFMPFPWRLRSSALLKALKKSLERLGLPQVDLYQIHWPFPLRATGWAAALADAIEAGLAREVGVSNYNLSQTRRAFEILAKHGIHLASNQVEYSLIKRNIERNGLLDLCRELNIRVIAYSPLGQGLLSGRYTPENPPSDRIRSLRYRTQLVKIQPLIRLMREIGEAHGGKTPAQVALNWTICKGTLPIPGAKNANQARQNAGAVGWSLTTDEVARLDELAL